MSETDLITLEAREVAARIAAGTLTVERVARAFLDRIADREPEVGAWIHHDPKAVIAAAQALDRAGSPGKLAGFMLGVKDVIDTADMPTEYGSPAYPGVRPPWDAACVALSREAGALVLGKTVTTEFAIISPGKTRNPHNLAHTPGGSSSGSAAAVGAGMAHIAFGTQTSGSTIRPAAFCGAVGCKPSFGLVNRFGVKTLADSLDTVGIIGRSVRDVAYFTAVISGRPALAVTDVQAPRVGLFATSTWDLAEPGTRQALDRAVAALTATGAPVSDATVPPWFQGMLQAQDDVMAWEVARALAFERLRLAERLTAKTREYLPMKLAVTAEMYDAAQAAARDGRARLGELFADCDMLLTPAAPGEAPLGLESTGNAVFNRPWTMLHVPCVTVPAGIGPGGLPVGVQLVGRIGEDARVLAAAAFLEDALKA
ncbi:MAG TPA: amidase [Stellaceae bacterium]|nr:amidase [Stellaceae bacterium]